MSGAAALLDIAMHRRDVVLGCAVDLASCAEDENASQEHLYAGSHQPRPGSPVPAHVSAATSDSTRSRRTVGAVRGHVHGVRLSAQLASASKLAYLAARHLDQALC
jgi:hypothetical protein